MRWALGIVTLAQIAVGICAGRVEIAQRRVAQAVRCGEIAKHFFDGTFGCAIRIDRCAGGLFRDRHGLWLAIDGRGTGKDERSDTLVDHGTQKRKTAVHIGLIEGGRIGDPRFRLRSSRRSG